MATEKLIDVNEVKKKLRDVMEWFDSYPSTEHDKLAQAVVKMCIDEVDKIKPVDAVVLHCKIGDTVFVLCRLADPDLCSKCPDFRWGGMGDSHECGKTEDGWRSPECIEIQEWTADLGLILDWIRYDEFNKTVFRTREEAEAALARMKG